MCGRYVSPDEADIECEFNLVRTEWKFPRSFNFAPTQSVPVIRAVDGKHQVARIRWGLIPFFAKGEPPKYSSINARMETVETAASYRGAMGARPTVLAGRRRVLRAAPDHEGRKAPSRTACMSPMPANDLMRHIHITGNNPHRMPAILRREDQYIWLNGSVDDASGVLAQYDPGLMVAHETTTRVNSPKNKDPTLIHAV